MEISTHNKIEGGVQDKNGNIIPEQVGYRLDRQTFIQQVYAYYFNNGLSKLEAPLRPIFPTVDSELLGTIRSQKIGEYVTSFNSENKERNNNIYLATEAINNVVIFPGEIFSFNKVVGERTARKGICQHLLSSKGNLRRTLVVEYVKYHQPFLMQQIMRDYNLLSVIHTVKRFHTFLLGGMPRLVGTDLILFLKMNTINLSKFMQKQ